MAILPSFPRVAQLYIIAENETRRGRLYWWQMKIVLISTYELGRQPFGLVSPAAWLRGRGHAVACFDLTRQTLDPQPVRDAELIAIYLPMHTATRLACKLIPSLLAQNPGAHICCYGLYAPVNAEYLRSLGVGTILGGEFEGELVRVAERLGAAGELKEKNRIFPQGLMPLDAEGSMSELKLRPPSADILEPPADGDALNRPPTTFAANSSGPGEKTVGPTQSEPMISLERLRFEVPDRAGLAPIGEYAHLVVPGDGYRVVGSTEASRGCKHLCRHCPIVPVYNGVFRIVERDVVLADVRQQVAAGAQHISFGDPDFLNGIRHAMELVEAFHAEFPAVTYDVTIKIEHLRKHEQHLARLRDTGCLFVISAVESVDDRILERLDKGHTREDFLYVARKFREMGMTLHPTFVPFTPWTTLEGYLDLLRVLAAEELIENVAPIQLGIRLLIPAGSRLLELDDVRRGVGGFDAESLVYPWRNADGRVDLLSEAVQSIAAEADRKKKSRGAAFGRIWEAAHAAAGLKAPELRLREGRGVPFLSEPWYCCAEPTRDQLVAIGVVAVQKQPERAVTADGFV
jgi:radical SAM superfamily enzyme YgiQ (UPF0313 family)